MIDTEFEFNGLFYVPISAFNSSSGYETNREEHFKPKDRGNVGRIVSFLEQRHFDTYFCIGDDTGHDMLGDYESIGLLGLGSPEALAYTMPEFNREIHRQGHVINGDGRGFDVESVFIENGKEKINLKPSGDLLRRVGNFFIRPSRVGLVLSSDVSSLHKIKQKSETLQTA